MSLYTFISIIPIVMPQSRAGTEVPSENENENESESESKSSMKRVTLSISCRQVSTQTTTALFAVHIRYHLEPNLTYSLQLIKKVLQLRLSRWWTAK
jgi:hypothetical protein